MITTNELINRTIEKKKAIPYINLDEQNRYIGWVNNFGIVLPDGSAMRLDLQNESDLFLLFALASSWSKTGPWENAAYFTTYLKISNKSKCTYWLSDKNVQFEIEHRAKNAEYTVAKCSGLKARKKVSFRKDFYTSMKVLASNWDDILNSLKLSESSDDYMKFINFISGLEGLGAGERKMRIKIPLILRELRCQEMYKLIPGEYCCVPDQRVILASKELGLKLPVVNNISSLLKASTIIYRNYGDLYDIPLFAYEDVV